MTQQRYVSGVYCILNLVNGKRYVGSSQDMVARVRVHFWALREDKHPNKHLQAAWNKYGSDNFCVMYLEKCPVDQCVAAEQKHINLYQAASPAYGYNGSPTAGSNRGVKHSQEFKDRLHAFHSNRSPEYRKKLSDANKGHVMPEEQRKQISNTLTGRVFSEEHRKKIGDAHRGMTHEFSDEVKQQMAKATSRRFKGKKQSAELVEKRAAANRGKKRSDETKQRISEAKKRNNALRKALQQKQLGEAT